MIEKKKDNKKGEGDRKKDRVFKREDFYVCIYILVTVDMRITIKLDRKNCQKDITATHWDLEHLRSGHEEADVKIIINTIDATIRGPIFLEIFARDVDILLLTLRRYLGLLIEIYFVLSQQKFISTRINLSSRSSRNICTRSIPCLLQKCLQRGLAGKRKYWYWKRLENVDEEASCCSKNARKQRKYLRYIHESTRSIHLLNIQPKTIIISL